MIFLFKTKLQKTPNKRAIYFIKRKRKNSFLIFIKAYVCYRKPTNAARHLNPLGEAHVTPPFLHR